MRAKMIAAVLGLGLAALALTGCGETLEQRVQNRDTCEAAGGTYEELVNGFTQQYQDWRCILTRVD